MLLRSAQALLRSACNAQQSLVLRSAAAARHYADTPKIEDSPELETRDVPALLAKLMHEEATKTKQLPQLKADVLKVIELMEDASPDSESPWEGKLKDAMKFMGKSTRNSIFQMLIEDESMKDVAPPLKKVFQQLTEVNATEHVADVAYKYMEILEGRTAEDAAVTITMTVASKANTADVEDKKAMLMQDLLGKGTLTKDQKIDWNVVVDPSILGGVVYNMGDVLVDCSQKALQDEFYASLSSAGIARVE